MSHEAPVQRSVRQLQIIAAALMGGVFLYTVVAIVVVEGGAIGPGRGLDGSVLGLVGLVAVLLLVLAPVLRARILSAARPTDPDEVVAGWTTASIAGLAVREAAGLLGITISLLAASVPFVLGFGVASLAAMGLAWPRGEELRERIRRLDAGR